MRVFETFEGQLHFEFWGWFLLFCTSGQRTAGRCKASLLALCRYAGAGLFDSVTGRPLRRLRLYPAADTLLTDAAVQQVLAHEAINDIIDRRIMMRRWKRPPLMFV